MSILLPVFSLFVWIRTLVYRAILSEIYLISGVLMLVRYTFQSYWWHFIISMQQNLCLVKHPCYISLTWVDHIVLVMGYYLFTALYFKWRNLKHFWYLGDCHSISRLQWNSFQYYQPLVVFQQVHFIVSHKSKVDFSEVWVAICSLFWAWVECVCMWRTVRPLVQAAPNPNT